MSVKQCLALITSIIALVPIERLRRMLTDAIVLMEEAYAADAAESRNAVMAELNAVNVELSELRPEIDKLRRDNECYSRDTDWRDRSIADLERSLKASRAEAERLDKVVNKLMDDALVAAGTHRYYTLRIHKDAAALNKINAIKELRKLSADAWPKVMRKEKETPSNSYPVYLPGKPCVIGLANAKNLTEDAMANGTNVTFLGEKGEEIPILKGEYWTEVWTDAPSSK